MKRYLLILLFLLFATPCYSAGIMTAICGGGEKTAACTTANDSKLWNPTTQPGTSTSAVAWVAIKFAIVDTKTITAYKIREYDNNLNTGSNRIVLMNHDAVNDYPDETSEVANSSVTKLATAIGAEAVDDYDLGTPFSLPAGTYWIVSQEVDSADIFKYYATSNGDRICYSSNAGSTWTCAANTAYDFELWGCN